MNKKPYDPKKPYVVEMPNGTKFQLSALGRARQLLKDYEPDDNNGGTKHPIIWADGHKVEIETDPDGELTVANAATVPPDIIQRILGAPK